jgi:HNH endonuclease
MSDWSPWRAGRPRVYVDRRVADYPAPNPQPTPCRLWQGAVDRYGYGTLSGRGKAVSNNHHTKIKAHRWVWEMAYGPIIEGLVVRHLCDNRLCFRLSHLELGTVAENNSDAAGRNHLGPSRALSPSDVDAIIARRAAGEQWKQIHADYPHVGLTTVRRAGQFGHGDRPAKPPPEPERYSSWREKGPPT